MKIVLVAIGKTKKKYLVDAISEYVYRLRNYVDFEMLTLPNIKNANNLSQSELVKKEGELILKNISISDYLVLLDEKGKDFNSLSFAKNIQHWMLSGKRKIVFLIGGSYGFSAKIYSRGNEQLSLSKMTFSHQMIRLFLLEQIYRGYTILHHEPYHHE